MSLPLRLPYCSPVRRLRAVLLFPCFRAPLTPPPSPACSQDPDSDTDGSASSSDGCSSQHDAWFYVPGPQRGHVFSGCAGGATIPQGPMSLPYVPPAQSKPRPGPPSAVVPAPKSTSTPCPGSRDGVRRPPPSRPPLLNRRLSAPKASWPTKDRQQGIWGGKEPEPRLNSRNEYDRFWRIREITPPPLQAPWAVATAARGGVVSLGEGPGGKKSAKLCKPASASQEKNLPTCRKIILEPRKGLGKPR